MCYVGYVGVDVEPTTKVQTSTYTQVYIIFV
jgi:hypothetical protein